MYSEDEEVFPDPAEPEGTQLDHVMGFCLRRVPAPAALADSVMTRISQAAPAGEPSVDPAAVHALPRLQYGWRAFASRRATAAVAATLLALFAGREGYLRIQEQRQAQAAAMQFALAMRLTRSALLEVGGHIAAHGNAVKTASN